MFSNLSLSTLFIYTIFDAFMDFILPQDDTRSEHISALRLFLGLLICGYAIVEVKEVLDWADWLVKKNERWRWDERERRWDKEEDS